MAPAAAIEPQRRSGLTSEARPGGDGEDRPQIGLTMGFTGTAGLCATGPGGSAAGRLGAYPDDIDFAALSGDCRRSALRPPLRAAGVAGERAASVHSVPCPPSSLPVTRRAAIPGPMTTTGNCGRHPVHHRPLSSAGSTPTSDATSVGRVSAFTTCIWPRRGCGGCRSRSGGCQKPHGTFGHLSSRTAIRSIHGCAGDAGFADKILVVARSICATADEAIPSLASSVSGEATNSERFAGQRPICATSMCKTLAGFVSSPCRFRGLQHAARHPLVLPGSEPATCPGRT